MKFVVLLGRVLFSSIFIIRGLGHFSSGASAQATAMGMPMAKFLVPLSGLLVLAGGLSILLGYRARIGAWLLVIFLAPTAFVMHRFWAAESGFPMMMQQLCFWKNLSLIGAALMISYFGSGPYSLRSK